MLTLKPITRHFQKYVSFLEVGSIGIDFTEDQINLVQFGKSQDGEIALKSACCIPYSNSRDETLSSPKFLRPILQKAIKENYFTGKSVVTSIPSSDVRILSINYQSAKSKVDSESLLKALSDRIDEDLSEYVIDYLPVRTSDKDEEKLALVALVKREIVITYLELLRLSGLYVEALEIRPAAVKRLIYSLFEPEDYRNILVINFGSNKSYLTIISGRRLLLDQELNFGAHSFIEKISDVLDMSDEATYELILKHGFESDESNQLSKISYTDENVATTLLDISKPILSDLIEEINRVLIFSASETQGKSISKIFLLGSIASWKGIDDYIGKKLKINVEVMSSPLESFAKSYSRSNDDYIHTPHLAVAAGLAMRGLVKYA